MEALLERNRSPSTCFIGLPESVETESLMESATVWGGEHVKFPAWSARVSAIRNLDTVVLGGATQSEVESGPISEVSTVTPGWKLIMLELWNQNTNSGCPTLSLSSQMMTTLSPRLTCFSLEPRIAALGW